MFKCKNKQNSRSKCYQMQIKGKICLWLENFAEMPSLEDMKGVKRYVGLYILYLRQILP